MELTDFDRWLRNYGNAWMRKDGDGFQALFSDDARYYWTPLEPPKCGPGDIRRAFDEAVSTQEDIHFFHEVLAVTGGQGIARWKCRFIRIGTGREVRLDGVLTARMEPAGPCREFREWWHSSENRSG